MNLQYGVTHVSLLHFKTFQSILEVYQPQENWVHAPLNIPGG